MDYMILFGYLAIMAAFAAFMGMYEKMDKSRKGKRP